MASYEQAKALLKSSVSRRTLYSLNIQDNNRSTRAEDRISKEDKNYLRLFSTRVSIPGIAVDQVTSIGQEHMGIQRNTAAGVGFGGNQLNINILENSDFTAYDSIRNLFNRSGINLNPLGKNGGRTQRMRYYDDYIFDIKVTKLELPNGDRIFLNKELPNRSDLDHGYKIVARYKFEKCYVQNIGELMFDSAATDSYLEFPVTFAFESYYHNKTKTMDLEFEDD